MSKKFLIILLFIVSTLSISLYFYFSKNVIETEKNNHNITLDKDGSTVSVKKGETLRLALDGSITTGYSWSVDFLDQSYLVQVGEMEYEADSNPRGLKGAPGKFYYSFMAIKSGETSLKMKYHRAFEKDVDPIDTLTLNIEISE